MSADSDRYDDIRTPSDVKCRFADLNPVLASRNPGKRNFSMWRLDLGTNRAYPETRDLFTGAPAIEVEALMLFQKRRPNRGSRAKARTLRQISGWLATSILVAEIAGCGISGTSGTTGTPEGAATTAETTAVGDEPSARPNENPGIMVTPAGGGGIVVGDPLEGDRGAIAAPAAVPATAQAAPPTAVPEQRAAASGQPGRSKKGRDEDEAEAAATAAGSPTPQVPGRAFGELEEGDGSPPAAQAATGEPSPRPLVGAVAEENGALGQPNGAFRGKREEAEADAARAAAAEDGRVEDVDGPPATQPNNPNAGFDRGAGRRERDGEDGDGRITPGVAGGQPGAEIEIKRGSAEEVTETFFSLVAAGEIEKVAPLIAGRATGVLGKLRDGTATPEEVEELKGLAAVRQQENNRPKGGTHRLLTFRADKKMLLVEAEQKEADCCVVKLDIREAPRRRK